MAEEDSSMGGGGGGSDLLFSETKCVEARFEGVPSAFLFKGKVTLDPERPDMFAAVSWILLLQQIVTAS